ncbi:hypothetical protein Bca52824_035250 [Brassica carinata]|uniref:Uncharacterized protein n=1 Tax=Brassica carinata TaxID=52824 RepID=A0A8X7S097_BRACI|nr:hypothetical protein Bca52824_035250 [Brassica carinata]
MRHADMNPAAPCNPFGGLTRLKAAERKLADIHFLVDKEVEELRTTGVDTMQREAEKFNDNFDYQAASMHRSMSTTSHRSMSTTSHRSIGE